MNEPYIQLYYQRPLSPFELMCERVSCTCRFCLFLHVFFVYLPCLFPYSVSFFALFWSSYFNRSEQLPHLSAFSSLLLELSFLPLSFSQVLLLTILASCFYYCLVLLFLFFPNHHPDTAFILFNTIFCED